MQESHRLLIVGFIMFLLGGSFIANPVRSITTHNELQLEIGSEHGGSADIPLNLDQSQSARIFYRFENVSETQEVWPLIYYQTPTKLVIETVTRYIDLQMMNFTLGWKNATYLNIYVIKFAIRVFNLGENSIKVNFTISIQGNPTSTVGIGLLFTSSFPLIALVLISKRYQPVATYPDSEPE